jgi:hypothetical protein
MQIGGIVSDTIKITNNSFDFFLRKYDLKGDIIETSLISNDFFGCS